MPHRALTNAGHVSDGMLDVTGGYIPAPARASMAAAYFTITNSGGTPDRLTNVSTAAFRSATLHRYVTTADGADEMVPMTDGAVIPAHGTLRLQPGHDHLMLTRRSSPLTQGMSVRLTLRFTSAPTVTMTVPVVAATGLTENDDSGAMSGMAGM